MSFMGGTGMAQGLTAVSGGLQAFGSYQAGNQAASASKYNSELYSQQAEQIKLSAARDVETGERHKASFLSSNRATFAFRGVKLSGSPLMVLATNAANLEADIRTGEYNTLIGASRAESAASMERMNARNQKMAGLVGAGTALLETGIKLNNFTANKPTTKIATSY